MARERKGRETEPVKGDMTPMIDVTFLLLIFFIVTLKFKILEGRLDAALPKDMGTSTTVAPEIEKVDILLLVSDPGELVDDPELRGLKKYVNRRVRYEIGTQTFRTPEEVKRFLAGMDKAETPITLDARKGIIYDDVVKLLDVVIELGFEKVSFAGTFENE